MGIFGVKWKISRKIGIPLTKSGRQRMAGRALGCGLVMALLLLGLGAGAAAAVRLLRF
jgi:hypothetical protein